MGSDADTVTCDTCAGTGFDMMDPNKLCPDCDGQGEVAAEGDFDDVRDEDTLDWLGGDDA